MWLELGGRRLHQCLLCRGRVGFWENTGPAGQAGGLEMGTGLGEEEK